MMRLVQILAVSMAISSASAFTTPIHHGSTHTRAFSCASQSARIYNSSPSFNVASLHYAKGASTRSLKMEMAGNDNSDNDSTSSSSRKRRTRKDGKQFSPPSSQSADNEVASTATTESKAESKEAPKQNTVVMQVRDIRDVLSGEEAPSTISTTPESSYDDDDELADDEEWVDEDDEELAEDEEWEYYDDDDEEDIGGGVGKTQDDSLEQLLTDARRMRAAEPSDEAQEVTTKEKIFDIISTIMTVDFFFVIALFIWFLVGIFCSYVLKDDAVQIAFNMQFEGVTRPALSVLMFGTIAGAIGNKDKEDEY